MTYTVGRRGIAGTVLVHKMVGAAAEKGYSLGELEALGNKVIGRTKTIGNGIRTMHGANYWKIKL
mgnify:CR=1 FL=1